MASYLLSYAPSPLLEASALNGKNLLPVREQIISFQSRLLFRREAKTSLTVLLENAF